LEADWEIELLSDSPVIDACWPGFVDLRLAPERVNELSEANELQALAVTLVRLNAEVSPVWTAKCDLWKVEAFDPYELDALLESADNASAAACYIDLLPRSDQQWHLPVKAVAACKHLCAELHVVPLRNCRADLIIRRAVIAQVVDNNLGVTAYLTACGATPNDATRQLGLALAAFADSVMAAASPVAGGSKLQ
jgi:hypothetical protein